MSRIKVDPAQLGAFSVQWQQAAGELESVAGRVGSALGGLSWEARQKAGVDGQANQARSQARALAAQAGEMARYLQRKAQAFEEADGQGVTELNNVIRSYPVAVPAPTPIPELGQEDGEAVSTKTATEWLDNSLETVNWVADHEKAVKVFRETLERIGRFLNVVTGKRGHIKLMGELGDILTGTAKSVSAASDLLTLRDFKRYFAGEINNREMAHVAVESFVPIPFIDDKIADWLAANVPDPDGKWHGLVGKVQ